MLKLREYKEKNIVRLLAGLVMVRLLENIIITASEVCLVVYFLRLVSAPASPTTPGRRRQEGGEQGRKWSRERE